MIQSLDDFIILGRPNHSSSMIAGPPFLVFSLSLSSSESIPKKLPTLPTSMPFSSALGAKKPPKSSTNHAELGLRRYQETRHRKNIKNTSFRSLRPFESYGNLYMILQVSSFRGERKKIIPEWSRNPSKNTKKTVKKRAPQNNRKKTRLREPNYSRPG